MPKLDLSGWRINASSKRTLQTTVEGGKRLCTRQPFTCERCPWLPQQRRSNVFRQIAGQGLHVRFCGQAVVLALLAFSHSVGAQTEPGGSIVQLPTSAQEYITEPVWSRKPSADELAPYRPDAAQQSRIAGVGVVDCTAKADGTLTNCSVLEVRPTGWQYELATPRAVSRLYRLTSRLPDGCSVAGMHVKVAVSWQ